MSEKSTHDHEYRTEKFPKPRTYPGGWDLSSHFRKKDPQPPAGKPAEERLETFPKPNTYPGGWDLSSYEKRK